MNDRVLRRARQFFNAKLHTCKHNVRVVECRYITSFQGELLGVSDADSEEAAKLLGELARADATYLSTKPLVDAAFVANVDSLEETVQSDYLYFNKPYGYAAITCVRCYMHFSVDGARTKHYEPWRANRLPPRLCLFADGTQTSVWPEQDDAMFALCVGMAALDLPALLVLEIFDATVQQCDVSVYTAHRRWQVARAVKERAAALFGARVKH